MFGYNLQRYNISGIDFYFVCVKHPKINTVQCFSNVEDAKKAIYELYKDFLDIHYNYSIEIPFNILNNFLMARYGEGHLFSKLDNHQMYITCK